MVRTDTISGSMNLRAGEWVEVRHLEEILRTLDDNQALDGLPFMPEMAQYCGRRFRVYKSAHKTCDTIEAYVIRRMSNAVHLEDLRCDGTAHAGCQAGCLLFWKNAWLKRVDGPTAGGSQLEPAARSAVAPTSDALHRATIAGAAEDGQPLYRCQATDLLKATTRVRRRERWDPRFYIKDLTSRNVSLSDFLTFGMRAAYNALVLHLFGWRYPRLRGLAKGKTPAAGQHLQAGDIVRVRSADEIMHTLSPQLKNRGLWFDVEMIPFCGSDARVLRTVDKLIDEKSGRLLVLSNPCVILDGVVCSGHHSSNRMFCPRALYPYWREVWLERTTSPHKTNEAASEP